MCISDPLKILRKIPFEWPSPRCFRTINYFKMAFTLDLIVNPVLLFIAAISGGVIGFVIGKIKLARSRSKVQELEKEMMNSHAEILELQKSYVQLENKLQQDQSIPVISMKLSGKDNSSKENVRKAGTPEK